MNCALLLLCIPWFGSGVVLESTSIFSHTREILAAIRLQSHLQGGLEETAALTGDKNYADTESTNIPVPKYFQNILCSGHSCFWAMQSL
jgi:hypothetical protein